MQCSCLYRVYRVIGLNYDSDCKTLLAKTGKTSMELKQISTLEIEICESINNLDPSIMRQISISQI